MSSVHDSGEEKRGFRVEDRRRFTASGEAREEEVSAESKEAAQSSGEGGAKSEQFQMVEPPPTAEISFSTFLISLATQALVHLGEIPDPLSREVRSDLGAARQTIDILGILEQKTRGNLDAHEAELLRQILFDLRLRYVEKTRS